MIDFAKLSIEEKWGETFLVCETDTALNGKKIYSIKKEHENEESFSSATCTTDMHEFIGNVVHINRDKCTIKGVFRGIMQEVKNVKILDKKITKIGQRVMGTEHLGINGNFEIIATTRPILKQSINFINFGWKKDGKIRQISIDIYILIIC